MGQGTDTTALRTALNTLADSLDIANAKIKSLDDVRRELK